MKNIFGRYWNYEFVNFKPYNNSKPRSVKFFSTRKMLRYFEISSFSRIFVCVSVCARPPDQTKKDGDLKFGSNTTHKHYVNMSKPTRFMRNIFSFTCSYICLLSRCPWPSDQAKLGTHTRPKTFLIPCGPLDFPHIFLIALLFYFIFFRKSDPDGR